MPRTTDETAQEFGRFLRGLRDARGLSLRSVEQMTEAKISNGYLSQLETGQVSRPSAVTIHTLAAAYSVDAALLMERSGLAPAGDAPAARLDAILGEVTPKEEQELVRYLAFMRGRRFPES